MTTFILVWNPDVWTAGEAWLDNDAGLASPEYPIDGDWSMGSRRTGIVIGDRGFLLRQKRERGLVASGRFTREIESGEHWDGSGTEAWYAQIAWDHILTLPERLPVEDLRLAVPEVSWDRLQGSGVRVPDDAATALASLWADHLGEDEPEVHADDVQAVYDEGAVQHVTVNRYERSRVARERCLEHHGRRCAVCGFDFEAKYGAIGRRGIHVHHLLELSDVGDGYRVDPIRDLIPVCPNCHAMLHTRRPALTPSELEGILRTRQTVG